MVQTTWLPLEDLAKQLFCSERNIYKLKASGVFQAGTCFYRIGNGQKKVNVFIAWKSVMK